MNSTYKPKFRNTVSKGLTDRGINIIYGDYIDTINADGSADGVVTRNNRRIDADLVVPTRGGRPNTAFLASSGFNLNSVGQVPVEKSFQVKGRRGVFAIGDITDIKEQKQAAKYGGHAAIVVPNVLAALEKREPSKQYGTVPEVMIVSNGKVRMLLIHMSCSPLTPSIERRHWLHEHDGWHHPRQLVRQDDQVERPLRRHAPQGDGVHRMSVLGPLLL
jgi:NADH dehydrogenase FAD-containing subunit